MLVTNTLRDESVHDIKIRGSVRGLEVEKIAMSVRTDGLNNGLSLFEDAAAFAINDGQF